MLRYMLTLGVWILAIISNEMSRIIEVNEDVSHLWHDFQPGDYTHSCETGGHSVADIVIISILEPECQEP